MSSILNSHGLRATRIKLSDESLSQHSSAVRVLQKMLSYDSGSNSSKGLQQVGEPLTCEQIAIMLDYAQKSNGKSLGVEMSKLRVTALCVRGEILNGDFERSGDVKHLDKAINYKRWATLLTRNRDTRKPWRLISLADGHVCRFKRLGELADIGKAITYQTQAVELTPDRHPAKPGLFNNLGNLYTHRFQALGELPDVDKAITYQTKAVELTPKSHSSHIFCLGNLGDSYHGRFQLLGELPDLEKGITCLDQALKFTPDDDPDKPIWLGNLGNLFQASFERLKELSDVDKAIDCRTRVVELTSKDDTEKPIRLSRLANSYAARFEKRGEPPDINNAITYHTQAVELTPDGSTSKSSRLDGLGRSYMRRFDRLGELPDVDKAIACHIHAVELTPDEHAKKPGLLVNLGNAYLARFERLGELAASDKAIACHAQAIQLTPAGHESMPRGLTNLGNSYQVRFEQLGELSDLDKAIAYHTQSVELTPDGDEDKPGMLTNLGNSCMRRFERLGEPPDITKAISCQTQAVELVPDGDSNRPAFFNNLGMSYQARFRSFGELSDIDKALTCHAESVKLTPDGHPEKPGRLGNLGHSYRSRFDLLGELPDVDKSIADLTQAVELTPDGDRSKPGWLSNLGNSFQAKFERLGDASDIEKAIACHTRAVELTPEGHPHKPTRVNNVGNSYQRRFGWSGELVDIERAIAYHTRAVELIPDGHVDQPTWINNLGSSYETRFQWLGEPSDGDKAIAYQSQAVKLTPEGRADRLRWLSNLGAAYVHRFERLGGLSNIELANELFQSSARAPISQPDTQFRCARRWAKCSSRLDASPKLAYQTAMELVPRLVWLGTTIERRYELMIEIGDVAMEAASWAISVEAYDLALEWLEEGRSIVWNQILQLRTSYDALSVVDSTLAQQLERTARELEHAGSGSTPLFPSTDAVPDPEQGPQRHHQLAAEWEQLLAKARTIDGFHNFMRPRKVDELRLAARNGPIVLINTHSSRCDALIVQRNNTGIAHIPLPYFSRDKAVGTCAQLASLLGRQGTRSRGFKPAPYQVEIRKILAMLWSDVVKPILEFLGYILEPPITELPHITWCTTGELSFLPLHAAGCYDGVQPNAPDLVVSSYTPTLGALLSPTLTLPSTGSNLGLLAVGQQFSNAHGDLPSIPEELDAISQHAANAASFQKLEDVGATADAVLDAMDNHSWVHLACHASQHRANPAHSAFHLHDGDLTLEAITKRSFKNKGLAFLSACQTAAGDEKRPDESIHLAAGMMMAGYPSVIATMWSIYDVDGPEVAGEVYAELLKDGRMDCTGAARALHKAVAGLRKKVGEDSFKRWVPFIHIGVSA